MIKKLKVEFSRAQGNSLSSLIVNPALGIANLPWMASALSNPMNLTHAAVGRGPIWLCAFGPAVLHGCTPCPKILQLTAWLHTLP